MTLAAPTPNYSEPASLALFGSALFVYSLIDKLSVPASFSLPSPPSCYGPLVMDHPGKFSARPSVERACTCLTLSGPCVTCVVAPPPTFALRTRSRIVLNPLRPPCTLDLIKLSRALTMGRIL